jgi:hypothetical protein
MIFDNSILADHVDASRFGDDCNLIPVTFLRARANKNNLDNKMLRVCILNCTVGSSSGQRVMNFSQYGAKRTKTTASTSNYNRYFLLADLQNPPHCAALMPRTIQETSNLLKYTQGDTLVGSSFCIYEPSLTFQSLGDSTPILAVANESFLPVKSAEAALTTTEKLLAYPTKAGETNFFILTGKDVSLHRASLVKDVSCSGIQCDRQKSKGECICLHTTSSNSLVYCFDVVFPIPPRIDSDGTTTVHSFRSLRTTELFFYNFEQHASTVTSEDELNRTVEYRKKINTMVQYINGNGGWTIVGWFMLGAITDAANAGDKAENYNMTLHLSYLSPTKDLTNDTGFNELKIGFPTVPPEPDVLYVSDATPFQTNTASTDS